ncbi:S1 family peptidase, partial [Clavibacter michiganensis subsp. tessellarius]|uniref:S1 family peptidase n=1 Tax=Clavibacter tessellarius TaxID=31965 RepID=UPI0036320E47
FLILSAQALPQNQVNALLDEVSAEYPSDFTGAWRDGEVTTVAFAREVPNGARDILSNAGYEVKYQTGVGMSESQLNAVAIDVHNAAVERLGEGVPVTSGPSVKDRTISVQVSNEVLDTSATPSAEPSIAADEPQAPLTPEVLADDIRADVGAGALGGFALEVQATESDPITDTGYGEAGGTALTPGSSGRTVCTSAFVVSSRSNADLGIVTAGHCEGSLWQAYRYPFDFRAESAGSIGDAEWRRSPRMMDAWFHYDYSLGRPQQGNATARPGDYVCAFGRTTGRTCGTVQSVGQQATSDYGTSYGLTTRNGEVNQGGDSGGPVYNNNLAYGITKGNNPSNGLNYFSPIVPVLQRFNLDLCIDPPGCS